MTTDDRAKLATIRRFDQLVAYLRDEMGWPIARDSFDDVDDLFFDFTPEELGIDMKNAAKIQEIKRLRPLSTHQPWGIFFVKFEPKRLPVVAMRRILSQVTLKKRATANSAERTAWSVDDLLFISNYGEDQSRHICFAHFSQSDARMDLPTLKVLGWDNLDTPLHLDHVAELLTERLAWPDDEEDKEEWGKQWHSAFTLVHREVITTSKKLSMELARLARNIRVRINTVLAIETDDGPISKLMAAFKETLIHDLDDDGFADMYAQTIAYGLLSARVAAPAGGGPTADDIATAMPVTNPFLRELMETFLDVGGRKGKTGRGPGLDFDELGVSEVVELLDAANMEEIILDFGDKNPQEDPVIHFYELFLKEYDAKKRMQRGVFYTPRPVVSFIVRSVDELLRTEFGLQDGLADTTTWGEMAECIDDLEIPEGVTAPQAFVQILDPATGTGTFLVEIIDLIYNTLRTKWEKEAGGPLLANVEDLWNDYVPKHLLPRLHGYELMMAPYAIAHMKIGMKLYETGYRFGSEERARVYLTNSLEPPLDFSGTFAFAIPALAHEARAVNAIKRDQRFTVVIGNPPYAGHSANKGEWISNLLHEYYFVDGEPLGERNPKWLQDDYVKFIRFGEFCLARAGRGVHSFITNHGYIDNPTFRGMRQHLMGSFYTIDVVDLHGNSTKKESCPDGSNDENVFDIKQGVAIFSARRLPSSPSAAAVVEHCHVFGIREDKYRLLQTQHSLSLGRHTAHPESPFYLFLPQDIGLRSEYESFAACKSVFPVNVLGFQTHRDEVAVGYDEKSLVGRVEGFLGRALNANEDAEFVSRCTYRLFDNRYVYLGADVCDRPRRELVNHVVNRENLCLGLGRQGIAVQDSMWSLVAISRYTVDANIFRRGGVNLFPLWLYPEKGQMILNDGPKSNIAPAFANRLAKALSLEQETAGELPQQVPPDQLVKYVYGILHSRAYRARYSEFLQIDFPRIPIPRSYEVFRDIEQIGAILTGLHLVESPLLDEHITTLIGSGDFQVEKGSYSNDTVWIDKAKTRGFQGVPENVWNFHIGGYQVCEKWLKDRGQKKGNPGRVLTREDIDHYQKIVVALSETIRIMAEIDEVITAHGGWPGAFQPVGDKGVATTAEDG